MAVDWDKPIQTKDGRPARLLGMRNHPKFPRVIAVPAYGGDGFERVDTCTEDGRICGVIGPHFSDIVNAPQRHVRWVNMYADVSSITGLYTSREAADKGAFGQRIACLRIEFEEGQGLRENAK